MPFSADAIANTFLDLAEADGKRLSPMKLQKLVYFAHGYHLGLTGQPLLDEQIQAWSFGPVIMSLYKEFADFGADDIDRRITVWKPTGPLKFASHRPSLADYPEGEARFVERLLKRVWDVYGPFTAIQLSNMTHAPGTPWDQVNQKFGGKIPKYATIPDDLIREFFEKLLKGRAA